MRTAKRALAVAALLLSALFLFPAGAQTPATLTVVADQWCPYNCDPASNAPGFGIEILKAIFEPKGIRVVYTTMPWTEALKETKAGKYSATIGGTKKDYATWVCASEETGISRTTAFVKKGSPWKFAGVESLAGKKVGVIESYMYDSGGKLDAWVASHPSSLVVATGEKALEDLMRKLLLGEVDVVFEDQLVFNLRAREKGLTDKFQDAGVEFELGIYVGFSPARPESKKYVEMYDQGVRELRSSMKLAGILKKYGVADWKK